MSRVLVYQANGAQGGATLSRVRQAGYITRALIRNPATAQALIGRGMEVAVADFHDREALLRAHEAVDFVILQIPAYKDAFVASAMENALFAMTSCNVKSAILKMANPTPLQMVPDSGFSANHVVMRAMGSSSIPYSIIEPTIYLDVLLKPSLREEISRHHLIDMPIDANLGVAWTTLDDAASMAVELLRQGAYGQSIRCAGEIAYRGGELAAVFSGVLGAAIEFRSGPVEVFRREIQSAIGVDAAAPVVSKFEFLARYPEEAARMLSRTFKAPPGMEFRPTSVEDWVGARAAQFRLAT